MTAIPIISNLTLTVPPDEGLSTNELPFIVSTTYEQKSVQELELTGTGSHTVGMGTVAAPGAKVVIIALGTGTAVAAVNVTINSGSVPVEVSPGGYFALASPDPTTGITSLAIAHTSAATVKVWIFG